MSSCSHVRFASTGHEESFPRVRFVGEPPNVKISIWLLYPDTSRDSPSAPPRCRRTAIRYLESMSGPQTRVRENCPYLFLHCKAVPEVQRGQDRGSHSLNEDLTQMILHNFLPCLSTKREWMLCWSKCAETFFTIDFFTSCYLLSHESNLDFKSIWKTTLQLEFIEHNNITAIAMG